MTAADYTSIYDPDTDFDAVYTRATGRRIAAKIRPGDRVLEPGCATGLMTAELAATGACVVAVDRSAEYLARMRERALPAVSTVCADVDTDALPAGPFEHVVATNLLHELADPGAFLLNAAAVLAPGGLIHVSLPNPTSLHRLIALDMGWIADLETISERGERFTRAGARLRAGACAGRGRRPHGAAPHGCVLQAAPQ